MSKLKAGNYVQLGDDFLVRDEAEYPARFDNFRNFYHSLTQEQYPPNPESQGLSFLFEEPRLQFLALNSAWEIDEYYRERSGIHPSALATGLDKANAQIIDAKTNGRLAADVPVLRLAVWHHPVTGNEKIIKDAFLDQLQQERFTLCLHGHVHEDRADVLRYMDMKRRLYVVGAGSFGAPANARPEATPRLHNLLEVWRDHSKVRVHTRCLRRDGGAWEGWAVWPDPTNPHARLTYYDITL